jgi:hypothetical protein
MAPRAAPVAPSLTPEYGEVGNDEEVAIPARTSSTTTPNVFPRHARHDGHGVGMEVMQTKDKITFSAS